MARRASVDISEIRRTSESDPRSKKTNGIPARIVNARKGEDLLKMISEERPREERARGWLMPND